MGTDSENNNGFGYKMMKNRDGTFYFIDKNGNEYHQHKDSKSEELKEKISKDKK